MNYFEKLDVWKRSIEFCKMTYGITRQLPLKERYSIIDQMNRCAISIPSNIAEGAGRQSKKDFKKFLHYSLGSSYELQSQIILCKELYPDIKNDYKCYLSELRIIQKMITALIRSLS